MSKSCDDPNHGLDRFAGGRNGTPLRGSLDQLRAKAIEDFKSPVELLRRLLIIQALNLVRVKTLQNRVELSGRHNLWRGPSVERIEKRLDLVEAWPRLRRRSPREGDSGRLRTVLFGVERGLIMRKANVKAAKLAVKRHQADLRRKKAQGGVAQIEAVGSMNYLAAAWLATKPRGERWGLLERYATRRELMDAIRQDTASHAAMARVIECDLFPGDA